MKNAFLTDTVKKQFLTTMANNGIYPVNEEEIIFNEKKRFTTTEDVQKGKKNTGFYEIHFDGGAICGTFGDWRHEQTPIKWTFDSSQLIQGSQASAEFDEYKKNDFKINQAKRELNANEKKQVFNSRSKVYEKASSDKKQISRHPYIIKKNIEHLENVKIDANMLLLPALDIRTGELKAIQKISPDGSKQFVYGSEKKGACCYIMPEKENLQTAEGFVICEGFATGDALLRIPALKKYVIAVAFDCGNLESVAECLKESYPQKNIFIGADDDWKYPEEKDQKNPGLSKALALWEAGKVRGVLVPDVHGLYSEANGKKMTDFNDELLVGDIHTISSRIENEITICLSSPEIMKEKIKGLLPITQEKEQSEGQPLRKEYSRFSIMDCVSNPAPIKWLIKGYLPEQSQAMIYGEPGCGKGFITVDICGSIASPEIETWAGKKVKHGYVVYFAGEGVAGIRQRFAGWVQKRGVNPENMKLIVVSESFYLDSDDENYSIENTIANIKEMCNGENPALVVFDTLNRYMMRDENSAKDMSNFLNLQSKIINALQCSILTIHHIGVSENAKNRARGSSALKGALDVELKVSKTGRTITVQQTKNKDAQEEKQKVFNLTPIEIRGWIDEDGEQVTTCIVDYDEYETDNSNIKTNKPVTKISNGERNARSTFIEAIQKSGIEITDEETGEKLIGVEVDEWRKIFYENSSIENQSTLRSSFNRAKTVLNETKHLIKPKKYKNQLFFYLSSTADDDFKRGVQTEFGLKRLKGNP